MKLKITHSLFSLFYTIDHHSINHDNRYNLFYREQLLGNFFLSAVFENPFIKRTTLKKKKVFG